MLERISIPPAADERRCEAFGFVHTGATESRRIREFAWTPALAFLAGSRTNVPFDDLPKLHDFLATDRALLDTVPIKERSLEIFGGSALFEWLREHSLLAARVVRSGKRIAQEHIGWRFLMKAAPPFALSPAR